MLIEKVTEGKPVLKWENKSISPVVRRRLADVASPVFVGITALTFV